MAAAFTSAFGGLGPLVTSFSFRDKDKPKFVFGHTVCLSMTVVCLMSAVLLRYILTRENQRRDANPQDISHLSPEEVLDLADNHPDFRYKI
ncbi:transporter [Dipsacomyces acuminosporus]|nr:transporter [Dipsacomyces acuminosporus]